ncbi:MAG: LON peptidase substrate-binding domain-containing protein, partial [Sphaerochaetaceae bacterium]
MAEHELMPVEQTLPRNLFVLPLIGNPIFPGLFTPLVVESREDIDIVNQAMAHGGDLGLLLVKDESKIDYEHENLYRVGTVAKIIKRIKLPDGGMNIFISTMKRFQVRDFHLSEKFIVAEVEYLNDIEDNPTEIKAWTRQLITETKKLSKGNPLFTEEMRLNMVNIDQAGKMADFIASIINIDRKQQQRILETLNVRKRMERVLVFIKKEQQVLEMQEQIRRRVNSKLEKNQREYFLREELKHIQQELGLTTDPRSALYNKLSKQIQELKLEGEVGEAVNSELEKFQTLDPNSPEYSITRTYLETIVA